MADIDVSWIQIIGSTTFTWPKPLCPGDETVNGAHRISRNAGEYQRSPECQASDHPKVGTFSVEVRSPGFSRRGVGKSTGVGFSHAMPPEGGTTCVPK